MTVWSFLIRYVQQQLGLRETAAADLLLVSLGCFVLGRFVATALMRCAKAERVACAFAALAALLCVLAVAGGAAGTAALVGVSLWMGPLFPTIFGLTLAQLDAADAEVGAAGLVMAIVGGAAVPPIAGLLSDALSLRAAYALAPSVCFAAVSLFLLQHARGAYGAGEAQPLIKDGPRGRAYT